MSPFSESVVEHAALSWLEGLGYTVLHLSAPPACARHADRESNAVREEWWPGDIAAGELFVEGLIPTA